MENSPSSSEDDERFPSPTVKWKIPSDWLSDCRANHAKTSRDQRVWSQPAKMRVIDTENGCVVDAPPGCEYATLSYVWGDTSRSISKATTQNIQTLQQEGSLFETQLPLTIKDAMTSCVHLGIQYLWVDQLCILQDHEAKEEAKQQINSMGAIYSRSLVTLVALAGENADHGLPGVSTVKRKAYKYTDYFDKSKNGYETSVHQSKWVSRGWTFQEALLSPRMLFFSNLGIFMECQHDDITKEEFPRLWIRGPHPRFSTSSSYQNMVREFSGRSFTFESDILDAFLGALQIKYENEHYFGLPFCIFNEAMMWTSRSGSYRLRAAKGGSTFPSWSWASVKDGIELPDAPSFLPFAIWAIPPHEGKEEPVYIALSNKERGWESFNMLNAACAIVTAWKKGYFQEPLPSALNTGITWSCCEDIILSTWDSLNSLYNEANGIIHGKLKDSDRKFPHSVFQPASTSPGSVLVYTQSLELRPVLPSEHKKDDIDMTFKLENETGDIIAFCDRQGVNEDRYRRFASRQDNDRFLDVVAISSYRQALDLLSWLGKDRYETGDAYGRENLQVRDCMGVPLPKEWKKGDNYPIQMSLLILETHDGISSRVGVGRAWFTIWMNARPEFNTFIIN